MNNSPAVDKKGTVHWKILVDDSPAADEKLKFNKISW